MKKHEALNHQLYNELRALIMANAFEFNTIYSETKLAASLSVSRTPIHDALVRLSQERYIDILPSKGFMLHQPNERDLRDARHFRLAIEVYCAEWLAENVGSRLGTETIRRMTEFLDEQRQYANPECVKAYWGTDVKFHEQLVSCLSNSYFDALHANCHYAFTSLPVKNFFEVGRHISTLDEHEAIIKALQSGDPKAAARAVQQHINSGTEIILSSLQKDNGISRVLGVEASNMIRSNLPVKLGGVGV